MAKRQAHHVQPAEKGKSKQEASILEDEEALHEGEDEAGISQQGLDRLMRALGPDDLSEMDRAMLRQMSLQGNDEESDEGNEDDEDLIDDEAEEVDGEDDDDEDDEDDKDLIDNEAEEVDGENDDEEDNEDDDDLIDDEAEEVDGEDDDDEDDEDDKDLIDNEAEEVDGENDDEEDNEDDDDLIDDEAEEVDGEDDNDDEDDDDEEDNADEQDEREDMTSTRASAPKDSLAASILRSGLVPQEEDDEEEEEEDEEEEDENGDTSIPLDAVPTTATLSEEALASRYHRIRINNTDALRRIYEDIRLGGGPGSSSKMPWIETMVVVHDKAIKDEVPDAQNDLDRELAFYRQSLAAATRGRTLVLEANVPFTRPSDYFAEMVKTDEHMERVRQRLLDESAGIKASENAKRQRELKKYGKKIQTEKLLERQRNKREIEDKVNSLKRKRQSDMGLDDDEFDVQLEEALGERKAARHTSAPKMSRQRRNEKFGFGGKKRHNKSNTADSTDQFGKAARRKPGGGPRPKSKKPQRPGKSRRAARR